VTFGIGSTKKPTKGMLFTQGQLFTNSQKIINTFVPWIIRHTQLIRS